ncbi:cytochrome c oxidase assembly protein [Pontibacter sp. 172403-2]|uniref:cytochrome c oxidase assembly protein n=1 Tax=Pontibacter rufus TaxID=2791028 RepID=UPI0018AFE18E|nr:cytochrome c oxidase assembly protein [Pontibacter sp. 172403-2]MBF9254045.1 cytochrome c oxidase assembly protein [Pontibacter sp. 172403-2]
MKELFLYDAFAGIPLCGTEGAADSIWGNWLLMPGVLLLIAGLSGLYLLLSGGKLQKGAGLYFGGLVLLLLVQSSPLHFLAMHYLFSAHMVGHIIILLGCAPLLVLGLPEQVGPDTQNILAAVSKVLSQRPWLGWLCGIGVMWFWHVTAVFDAAFPAALATGVNLLPLLLTFSLLLAGALFAWPILGPLPAYRINPLLGVLYLFTACVGCSLLGLLITFAPLGIYHHYLSADAYGFDGLIRKGWGITAAVDQQMAGLIMWVPCCFVYLSGSLYLLHNWLTAKDGQPLWKESGLNLEGDRI